MIVRRTEDCQASQFGEFTKIGARSKLGADKATPFASAKTERKFSEVSARILRSSQIALQFFRPVQSEEASNAGAPIRQLKFFERTKKER